MMRDCECGNAHCVRIEVRYNGVTVGTHITFDGIPVSEALHQASEKIVDLFHGDGAD